MLIFYFFCLFDGIQKQPLSTVNLDNIVTKMTATIHLSTYYIFYNCQDMVRFSVGLKNIYKIVKYDCTLY